MWLIAWGAAALDCGALLCGTLAYQRDRAGSASLLSYLAIVYGFVVDTVIFNEQFHIIEPIAAIVILLASLGIAFYKLRQGWQKEALQKQEKQEEKKEEKPL